MPEPRLFTLPKIEDPRGNLSFLQQGAQVPFEICRCYWIYDVPGDGWRDGHAFRRQREVIVALSGSFDVELRVGGEGAPRRYSLNRSYLALYVPAMTWRRMDNFSTNSVALVLASTSYDPGDYLRDYEQFKSLSGYGC